MARPLSPKFLRAPASSVGAIAVLTRSHAHRQAAWLPRLVAMPPPLGCSRGLGNGDELRPLARSGTRDPRAPMTFKNVHRDRPSPTLSYFSRNSQPLPLRLLSSDICCKGPEGSLRGAHLPPRSGDSARPREGEAGAAFSSVSPGRPARGQMDALSSPGERG